LQTPVCFRSTEHCLKHMVSATSLTEMDDIDELFSVFDQDSGHKPSIPVAKPAVQASQQKLG